MKRWYQSAFCKGILILLAHISLAAVMFCMLIGVAYPGQNYGELFTGHEDTEYEETTGFANKMMEEMSDIGDMLHAKNLLSKDGAVNPDTVIDIPTFHNERKISDTPGEFSYKLSDIINHNDEVPEEVIVCQRPEGELEYQYYTREQFVQMIWENDFHFQTELEGDVERGAMLARVEKDSHIPEDTIVDKDGKIIFKSMWSMDRAIYLSDKTAAGKTLMEIANTSAEWNGRLNEMCEMLQSEKMDIPDLYENYTQTETRYREGETNLSYLFVDYDSKKIHTNRAEYQSYDNVENSIQKMMESGKYALLTPSLSDCSTNAKEDSINLESEKNMLNAHLAKDKNFKFIVSVNTDYPIQDSFYKQDAAYDKYMPWMSRAVGIGLSSVIVFFICLIWLTAVAGRSNQQEGVALLFYDRWKTEIGLCLVAVLIGGAFGFGIVWIGDRLVVDWNPWYWEGAANDVTAVRVAEAMIVAIAVCAAFLTGYLSLVRRIKAKSLWKNSILRWLVHTLNYIYVNRSSVTKGIIVGSVLFAINLLMMTNAGFFVMLAVVVDALAVVVMVKRQIEKEKIKKGIMRIADGDAEYKIPLGNLTGDNKDIAEKVNRIGEGIQNAVEKSLKDERLKTDLITNVSHDIKTPLTSIINYVGLLKQEQFDDPKIQRYLEILDQKSQRLKTLTEDVVEASKISSGNINLELINLNLVEMIHQTTGEFTEKFENKELKMVMNIPEEPVVIRVDGRRMWRVIENIYNNAAKYAMPGTRIYADMTADGNVVQFALKNVSEHPLNITADELTERFIRGDISRSTEGSGLGLSIAKNLTEMQGGEFKLYVDGDLFKVTITFPQIKTATVQQE